MLLKCVCVFVYAEGMYVPWLECGGHSMTYGSKFFLL